MRAEEYCKICGYCAEKTYVTPEKLYLPKNYRANWRFV